MIHSDNKYNNISNSYCKRANQHLDVLIKYYVLWLGRYCNSVFIRALMIIGQHTSESCADLGLNMLVKYLGIVELTIACFARSLRYHNCCSRKH